MTDYCVAEGITFRYFENTKRNILEDASFSFAKGETVVLVGNSGCGKSTLAAVLCGLYPENGGFLAGGKISIDGRDLGDMPFSERCREISMVFQNPDLQFCMSNLREELYFCLENISVPREKMETIVDDFVQEFHAEELLDRPFSQLSGGEKQRAALYCILLLNPRVLVLDEPFANLDTKSREEFLRVLHDKVKIQQTTIIAIDHHASNWQNTADRYLLLGEKGSLAAELGAEELEENREEFFALGLNDPIKEVPKKKQTGTEIVSPLLVLDDAAIYHKNCRKPQLAGVSLTCAPGEMVACLGASGGGKTSLFLALLGQKKYRGTILLDQRELKSYKKKELFSKVGIVFQNPANQFLSGTVLDEMKQSIHAWDGKTDEKAEEAARELLKDYQLHGYAKYSPYMLSQGQQRRLGVLLMISGGQKLLLLDEPTYGQDGRATKIIMEQMRERCKTGLSVIFTTHDEALAYTYGDRIWRVEKGCAYEED